MNEFEPELGHRNGVVQLLQAGLAEQGSTGITVYVDGVPSSPVFPYLVVWGVAGEPLAAAERMRGWGREIVTNHPITAAGLTVDDVLGAVGRARHALHRRRPVVPGRRCGDLSVASPAGRPIPDPQPTPAGQIVYSLAVFAELHSTPI